MNTSSTESRSTAGRSTPDATVSLLALIAAILLIAALKETQSVTLPLAFAIFIVALAWPLLNYLAAKMPHKLAFLLTILIVFSVFALFAGALYFCAATVASRAPHYTDEVRQMHASLQEWGFTRGIKIPGASEIRDALSSGAGSTLRSSARPLFSLIGLLVLTFAFLGLGLMDARRLHRNLQQSESGQSDKWLVSLHQMADKFGRYFWVRSGISLIQGVCTVVFSLVIGLEFALMWGLMSALLNFVPTLGSLVAVVPPTLWALFQFKSPLMAAVVFAGNCVIQLLLGSFVDPLLQGKQLQLSPLAVLFSIAFWGWVWGIGGALIGVPITVAVVIVCREFGQLTWLADLVTADNGRGDKQ